MQWQPRDSPISSNSTDYLARTTSAPAFQILEIMPTTAPRAARGRTDAAEAMRCADLAPTNLAALTSKIITWGGHCFGPGGEGPPAH